MKTQQPKQTVLQFNLFETMPTFVGTIKASPEQPQPKAAPLPAAPSAVKSAPALAVPGLGGKAQPGDWVRLGSNDKFARDFGYTGGVVDAVVDSRWPLPGLLLTYGERDGRQTRLLGGFRTPHAFENIAEVWRKAPDGTWSKVL